MNSLISFSKRSLFAWLFSLSLAGYSVVGLLAAYLRLENRGASAPFRVIVFLMALALALQISVKGKRNSIHPLILLFWFLYIFRLVWDSRFGGLDSANEALMMFLVTEVVPGAALICASAYWNEQKSTLLIFIMSVAASVLAVVLQIHGYANDIPIDADSSRLSFETLNPILLGHTGVMALIAGFALFGYARRPITKLLIIAGSVASLPCIVLAASRGPIVALFFCIMVLALARRNFVYVIAAAGLLILLFSYGDGALVVRFAEIKSDESALERITIQADAIQQFLANPLFGSSYVEKNSMHYPHNMFIEAAMALGIVGVLLLILITVQVIRKSMRGLRNKEYLLPLLYFQSLIAWQFSGSLWAPTPLWICTGMIIALSRRNEMPARPAQVYAASH